MTAATYELSEQSRAFVEAHAAAEGFASPGAYLDALVRQAQVRKAKQALEAKLLKAIDAPKSEMTQADWARLRQRILDRSPELRGVE